MLRWIVSLSAIIAVSSVFAQGSFFDKNNNDGGKGNNEYCPPTPPKCDPVPEPASVAVMAVGGLGLLLRKRKKSV